MISAKARTILIDSIVCAELIDLRPGLIDSIVCAELPDVSDDPLLYALVDEFMVHGPCGNMNMGCPCMKDGICSKRFPKSFNEATIVGPDGFVAYRRRDDGRFVAKGVHRLNNRWIVPYNPKLMKKYQAHINVERCNKTHLVKYLFKYVHKGNDRAKIKLYAARVVAAQGASVVEVASSDPCSARSSSDIAEIPISDGIDEVEEYILDIYLRAKPYGGYLHLIFMLVRLRLSVCRFISRV